MCYSSNSAEEGIGQQRNPGLCQLTG